MEKLIFEKKRTRVKYCPCGKSNRDGKFVPYTGFDDKGYCHSCDQTFITKVEKEEVEQRPVSPPPPKQVSFIDTTYLDASLKGYDQNNFVQFLINMFGKAKALQAVEDYKIGTSKRWPGATIFWQLDASGKIRSGKIMLYDPSTGKRQNKNSWVHSVLKLANFNLNQCLFGAHLIRSEPKNKPVSIVESEKTAIIASILRPDFIWLSNGGKAGLKASKFKFLRNRRVILFPDLTKPGDRFNCFEMWSDFANELTDYIPGVTIQVSDYLETWATVEEKSQGLDIADYLLKWEWDNVANEANAPIQKTFISKQKERIEEDEEIRLIENEINDISKQIYKVIRGIRAEREKESKFRNEIRNHFIPERKIQAVQKILREYRRKYGY
ncbi:MAG: DUF6371 domain-containing protein [Fulvivirga sp.]